MLCVVCCLLCFVFCLLIAVRNVLFVMCWLFVVRFFVVCCLRIVVSGLRFYWLLTDVG